MKREQINDLVSKFLSAPHFRMFRHSIFLFFLFLFSIGSLWGTMGMSTIWSIEKYIWLSLFLISFVGGCYLNIYVLVPRFLINNRWGIYLCYLSAIVFCNIITILFIHGISLSINLDEFSRIALGMLSSFLALFFLFVGTSTFVLFKYWIQDIQQAEELESTTLQLELKMLENQINPHFLFNMLNNANIMIKKDSDTAVHIIRKLEDILNYQINESSGDMISLIKEIAFLHDFLELEKIRRDSFTYTIIEDEEDLDKIQMPPLLFTTFVENAVKHNQDPKTASYVHLEFKKVEKKLVFICENSIPQTPSKKEVGGIGLINIKRRLDLLYKDNYTLENIKTETNYTVKLELVL